MLGFQRFLTAFDARGGGRLARALAEDPEILHERYTGEPQVLVFADWLHRHRGALDLAALAKGWRDQFGTAPPTTAIRELVGAGWCLDGDKWNELVPHELYYTGLLWPKYDRAIAAERAGEINAAQQVAELKKAIGMVAYTDFGDALSPTHTWIPLDIVQGFVEGELRSRVELERANGVLQPAGIEYGRLNNTDKGRTAGFSYELLNFLGWANYDKRLWRPPREKVPSLKDPSKEVPEPIDEARKKYVTATMERWRDWLDRNPDHIRKLERVYNRTLRGFVAIPDDTTPIPLARWRRDGDNPITPRPWQWDGARRLIRTRGGLLAFDVGLGKTYAALVLIARARQEGWMRRPVVLVPNSIAWKWHRDFARVLPSFRVDVVGSKRVFDKKKKRFKAVPDSAEERAAKWTRLQAGQLDAVILVYSAVGTTQLDASFVDAYVSRTTALRRAIEMAVEEDEAKKAAKGKGKSERGEADAAERQRAWLGEVLSPPGKRGYDPGVDWHHLGIDGLIVDEAQNFKNLFFTQREAGDRAATKQAWALDLRAASVRERTGGRNIFLLSATPAKNSPAEWFSLFHIINPKVMEEGVAIDNPESFVDRFGLFIDKEVPDPTGTKMVKRTVCVGLQNTDQLHNVMDRWAVFRTAEMVGLSLPEVNVLNHTVELTDTQRSVAHGLFAELAEIEDKLKTAAAQAAGRTGGDPRKDPAFRALVQRKTAIAMRLYLCYLHPGLVDTDVTKAAAGPKLQACVDQIMATASTSCASDGDGACCFDCGHIVFVDNIAVHHWLRDLLVTSGVDRDRIAVLNAEDVPDLEHRQQIAEGFNGVGCAGDDVYEPPKYDVVIANAVAYEGMDLQRRTCALHHLDVPWEPATLQQRNGRGVRQGNTFDLVGIHYYFVKGSNEQWKVSKIERKRGWMDDLFAGSARSTNTTREREDEDYDALENFLQNARPEDRQRFLDAANERKAIEAAAALRAARRSVARQVNDLNRAWRLVEREYDDEVRVARFRKAKQQTEKLRATIAELAAAGTPLYDAFDYAERIDDIAHRPTWAPVEGPPLREGDRIAIDGVLYEVGTTGKVPENEVPRIDENGKKRTKAQRNDVVGVWLRERGRPVGTDYGNPSYLDVSEPLPGAVNLDAEWPDDADAVRWDGGWYDLPTVHRLALRLPDDARARLWAGAAKAHLDAIARGAVNKLGWTRFVLPVLRDGRVPDVHVHTSQGPRVPSGSEILSPTREGWLRWVAACRSHARTLDEEELTRWLQRVRPVSRSWWGRGVLLLGDNDLDSLLSSAGDEDLEAAA